MKVVILSLLFFGFSTFGNPRTANDNLPGIKKCELLLIEKDSSLYLNVHHATATYASGRRHVREVFQKVLRHWIDLRDGVNFRKSLNRQRKAEDSCSSVTVTPQGNWIESVQTSKTKVTLTFRSGTEFIFVRSFQVRSSDWLGLLDEVSPDEGYLVLRNSLGTNVKVVSTYSGKPVFERQSVSGQPIQISFLSEEQMEVRQGHYSERFRLSPKGAKAEGGVTTKVLRLSSQFANSNDPQIPKISNQKFTFAVRFQKSEESWMGYIDISDNKTKNVIRTIPVPAAPVKLALSPSGRTLAVSCHQGGVRLYDLHSRSFKPSIILDFDNSDGRLLAFADERTLLAGSMDLGEIFQFELSKVGD